MTSALSAHEWFPEFCDAGFLSNAASVRRLFGRRTEAGEWLTVEVYKGRHRAYVSCDDGVFIIPKVLVGRGGSAGIFTRASVALLRKVRRRNETSALPVAFMPGFACNLSCSYCYQRMGPDNQQSKPILERFGVTDEILSEFIWRRAAERSCHSVSLTLLGGEPLVYMRQLVPFLACVKEHGEISEIDLVTNGTLLEKEVVESLRRFAPVSAQVTFDGDRSHHDAYRSFRSLEGSYDRILSNIGSVREELDSLRIRINLTPSNIENARAVIDDLGVATELKGVAVSLAPLDDTQYFSVAEEWDGVAFQRYCELARYVVSAGADLSPPGHSGTCLTCGDSEDPGGARSDAEWRFV